MAENENNTPKPEDIEALANSMKKINAEVDAFLSKFSDVKTQGDAINDSFTSIAESMNISNSLTDQELKTLDKQLEVLREQVKMAEKYNLLKPEELKTLKNIIEGSEEQVELQKEHAQAVKGTVDKLIGAKKETMGIKMHMEAIDYIQTKMSKEEAMARVINKAADAVGAYFKAIISATFEFDKSASKVAKTLSNTQYKGMMNDLRNDALYAGASVEELGENIISLGNNFTDFTRLSTDTQKELSLTATQLNAAGFSAEAFAKTLDIGVKTLGMSQKQVQNFSKELVNFGKAAGIPMGKLSNDLAKVGPQLSKFGSNAERTFKQLSLQAKATGVELDRMFGITEQYTTFDGAAKAAGNLNAILGGNFVNSLDLMNASLEDPAEAIQLLKDSMDASGKSFDDMPNAMKRVVAEAAGFQDVGEAARIFGMDSLEAAEAMEEQAATQEQLTEASRSFLDIQTKIQLMMAQLVPVIMPVIDILGIFIDGIARLASTDGGKLVLLFAAVGTVVIGVGIVIGMFTLKVMANLALIKQAFWGVKNSAEETKEAMQDADKAGAKKFGETIKAIGEAAKNSWREILAFGAAILMIGGGIALAVLGLAELVKAFQNLTGPQIFGALGAMLIVMGGFILLLYAMVPAIGALGTAGAVVAGPLLALGAAVALIGLGIGIAAAGLSLLVSSFKDLAGPQLVAAGLALAGIAIGVGLLVVSLSGLGNPLAAAGAAVLLTVGGAIALIGAGIGLAAAGVSLLMKEIPTAASGLKSFSENLENFADPSGAIKGLTDVAEAIQKVADAIDEVSMTKLLLLKTFGGISGTASPIAGTTAGTNAGFGVSGTAGSTVQASTTSAPINIELTIPVKIEGSEFKNVMAKVVQEEIQKNATNASSVNIRIK